jgi:hypothetical protein
MRIVSNFFENSRRYLQVKMHYRYFTTGINDTGGKFATFINYIGGKNEKRWQQVATGSDDTGGKFVVDTGEKFFSLKRSFWVIKNPSFYIDRKKCLAQETEFFRGLGKFLMTK